MNSGHILLLILWVLYGVLHSVLASFSIKNFVQKNWPFGNRYYRLGYTIFAFISFGALLWFQFTLDTFMFYKRTGLTNTIGIVLGLSGMVLMIHCIKKYFFSLSGIRSLISHDDGVELHISGIHRHLRHPLYLGTFAFVWGVFIFLSSLSWLIASVVLTGYTLIGIRLEERKLLAIFGEQYRRYQEEVPMLIPRPGNKKTMPAKTNA
jgi:protein-S-isoprenylcysteine O-methyltransferase Ste14